MLCEYCVAVVMATRSRFQPPSEVLSSKDEGTVGGDSLNGSLKLMKFGEFEYCGTFLAHSLVWVFGDGSGESVVHGRAAMPDEGVNEGSSLDVSRTGPAACGIGIASGGGGDGGGGVLLLLLHYC